MASVNDVTGDRIVSGAHKENTDYKKFSDNWDAIFGKKETREHVLEYEDNVKLMKEMIPEFPVEVVESSVILKPSAECRISIDKKAPPITPEKDAFRKKLMERMEPISKCYPKMADGCCHKTVLQRCEDCAYKDSSRDDEDWFFSPNDGE